MVDLDWKSNMVKTEMSPKSPKPSLPDTPIHKPNPVPSLQLPFCISATSPPLCSSYENYLRLPHLRKLWSSNEFPNWENEPILKPALQALEITFRFVSTVFSDPRPYANRRQWSRTLESLSTAQIQIIALLCQDEEENRETRGAAPIVDLGSCGGYQSRSYSEASLLPRLATCHKSKDVAQRILSTVECEMTRCSYTLGLGEANVSGKPILRYDAVCKPNEIHSLITTACDCFGNYEKETLQTTHQMIESWLHASHRLLERIACSMESRSFEKATKDCYVVERIWKLLAEIEDLHLLMDPEDFLRLKKQLSIRSEAETTALCFRSKELAEITKMCKDLKHKVPEILEVEVDPKGGPRIQEAAMKLYMVEKRNGFEKIHLLQAMQAIESAMKRFFYAYRQVVVVVMGSSEANGHCSQSGDSLSQIFLEPTYFPSLDAAKTFLGYYWDHNVHVRQFSC